MTDDDNELIISDHNSKPYHTLTELRQLALPPPVDVVAGLIAEGETLLLVGRPKVGKSRLVLQLAISLSRGEPFLTFPIPRPKKVLILDLENRLIVMKERLNKMAPDKRPTDDNIVVYATDTLGQNCIGLENPEYANLLCIIESISPDVMIIDPWRVLGGTKDENKSELVVNALKKLSQLKRTRPGLIIIIVHHLRKQGKAESRLSLRDDPSSWIDNVSGHHSLVAHVDACYGLDREPSQSNMVDGGDVIVFGGVARNASSTCLVLDEDEQSLLFSVASGRDALLDSLTTVEKTIFDLACKADRGITFTEVLEVSKSNNRKAVSSMLRKAEKHGVLRKQGEGKGALYLFSK